MRKLPCTMMHFKRTYRLPHKTFINLAQRDDPTFGRYLVRRARRETFSVGKRAEVFLGENFYILGGFSGGILVTSLIS